MIEMFSVRGYTLLDLEYVNAHNKHRYVCDKHVEFGVQDIALNHFKKGSGCRECSNEKKRERKKRRTTEEVFIFFQKRGLVLSGDQVYKNNLQKLKFICPNHLDIGEQEITLDGLRAKVRDGCPKCSSENRTNAQKKNFSLMVKQVEEFGYKVISNEEDFDESSDLIKIRCKKHGDFEIAFANLLYRERCPECGINSNGGETQHSWTGGISLMSSYLRGATNEWKKESLENSNYKCALTGKKGSLEVHHLYGFNLILKEAFNNLGVEIKNKLHDYSDDEILSLKAEVVRINYKYGFGVCLKKDIHKLFHRIYGAGNNNPHQFEEFSSRYSLGEFDGVMLEKQMNKGVEK